MQVVPILTDQILAFVEIEPVARTGRSNRSLEPVARTGRSNRSLEPVATSAATPPPPPDLLLRASSYYMCSRDPYVPALASSRVAPIVNVDFSTTCSYS